jgi:hypothetical protein
MGFELAAGYHCPVCGEHHAPLPLSFSAKAPAAVSAIALAERDSRVQITADQCVIDQRRYFLRGRILVPLHEVPEPFIWGVWAEIGAADFYRAHQQWTVAGRETEPAFPGELATEIPFYAGTLRLRLEVQTQPVGQRPQITLADALHPLAAEQREGMSLDRVKGIAAAVRHGLPDAA